MGPNASKRNKMENNLQEHSHKRFNILTGEWVLVSPHRAQRPWHGQSENVSSQTRPSYEENCYLCPGNSRAKGAINPNYKDVFVFENDYSALQARSDSFSVSDGLLHAESETGICKVICFSPDHSKSLAQMEQPALEQVVRVWQLEYASMGTLEAINCVQIFENKGAVMGCSNPHPHGQIWGQSTLPNEVIKKDQSQLAYFQDKRKSLLGVYLMQEMENKERIIYQNDAFVVLVPFWAIWPFETMIVPKCHQSNISQMTTGEVSLFAQAISVLTQAYDQLFNTSFPYSSGIHQAPTNGEINEHWHWHMSFYPPLLRSATVKKFMVGYEMFGTPQRDFTPEVAADRLRGLV